MEAAGMAGTIQGDRARYAAPGHGDVPLIWMYHSVSPHEQDPYQVTVRPERFEQQMRWLRRHGRRGVSVREMLDARAVGHGHGLVGLTFDDGYADFARYALPVLQRYGFSATVYVIAGRLGGDNEWDPEGPRKPLMTAELVRQVAEAGIEIGSHGLRHVSLPTAPKAALAGEIAGSRRALQDISGQDVPGFCYPYGHIDAAIVAGVHTAGYDYGCAIWPSEHTGRHALPRTFIGESDSAPRLWAKGLRHWLTWHYRGPGAPRHPGFNA
jgi:peptidoglycan/xylan/chitin deacetylase (PgdA/CDA1 family)